MITYFYIDLLIAKCSLETSFEDIFNKDVNK